MSEKAVLHEAIRDAANPMTVLDRIVAQSMALVPNADGASLEVRRDAETLEYISAAGTLAEFVGLRLPIHSSLSGRAVLTGEVQLCDDGLTDPRANRAAVERTGLRSMLCVPLSSDEQGVAVLKVSARCPGAFTDDDADRLGILARFLNATVSAASELARVTADVLSDLDDAEAGPTAEEEVDAARFVANVMTPGLVDRAHDEAVIRDVIDSDLFTIVLQPIVELSTGRVVSCEALSRIGASPDRPPDWWFASAHRAGLGVEFEAAAVTKALAAFDALPSGVGLSVNVGRDLILDGSFADTFAGSPIERLTIELTEHDEIPDYEALVDAIARLRAEGACLSVDDTGAGYSGLTHILRLRPDVIKLDRELVTGIDQDPAKRALASGLVVFARSIDARVVAEGIEHQEELDVLVELGVDHGQGFLIARPMPAGELTAMLHGR